MIIGCNKGSLLSGDFCKNGHFPPFTITFGLAGPKLQAGKKWQADCFPSAHSVTRPPPAVTVHSWSACSPGAVLIQSCPNTALALPRTVMCGKDKRPRKASLSWSTGSVLHVSGGGKPSVRGHTVRNWHISGHRAPTWSHKMFTSRDWTPARQIR